MINVLFALCVFLFLFCLLWISVIGGYKLGILKHEAAVTKQGSIVKLAEGTIFALLGLLIAFTFAGAYERFETRELKIIDEIGLFKSAYEKIELLAPEVQPSMRETFKEYLDARISLYQRLTEFQDFSREFDLYEQQERNIWLKTIDAVKRTNNAPVTLLFVNSVDKMVEIAITRLMLTQVHPPLLIFILLITLSALCAFLTGYSMSRYKNYNSIYAFSFVVIMAFTLYVVIDLELPRVGVMQLKTFDGIMASMADNLK